MTEQTNRAILIVKLLEKNTSQSVVQNFLKANGIPKSFKKWNTLYDERISEGLSSGKISLDSLHELLEDAEEHGKQHVFLYACDDSLAKKLIEPKRIAGIAKDEGTEEVLNSFSLEDIPEEPTLTNIRFETVDEENALVIKVIEKRESREYIGEVYEDGYINKKYKQTIERGVNTVRLRESGLLELRIGSHKDSSDYRPDIKRLLRIIGPYIRLEGFAPLVLTKALKELAEKSDDLSDEIRFTHSEYTNDEGVSLRLAMKRENASLLDNVGATSSATAFKDHDGHVNGMNIWFKKRDDNPLNDDIHVLLTGELNEFALPGQCRKDDYEHVLRRLLELNS